MLFKIFVELELLATEAAGEGSAFLVDPHVEVALTIHLEAGSTSWNRAHKFPLQNVHNFFVVSQLVLVSESLVAPGKPTFENFYLLMDCKVTSQA